MSKYLLKNPKLEGGLAMTELAIVMPVCLFLLLATIELGRGFMQYNSMTKTIRDGARFAAELARTSAGTTGIATFNAGDINRVRNLVVFGNIGGTGSPILPGLTASNVTVTSPSSGDIAVRINYAYQPVFFSIESFGLGNDINPNFVFQNEITMRVL